VYLKRSVRRKGGEEYESWSLVESVRTARGPRQRTVATLGKLPGLDDEERVGWEEVGRILDGKPRWHPDLFFPHPAPPAWATVDLSRVRVERVRRFGDVYLGLSLWRRLGLHTFFEAFVMSGREDVNWAQMACVLAVARLCCPSSELHIAESWYGKSALGDLLGVAAEKMNEDRLYRALDVMEPLKEDLMAHLKQRYTHWFGAAYDFLLYDVTSTYFEGLCPRNRQARRGYSRDGRPDCLQICIGLVVTTEGLPIAYEVFDGNRTDVTTVREVIALMEDKYGKAGRIWVMDRGMVSEENLEELRRGGAFYIVGTPKASLKGFERDLLERGWREVAQGVEVKLCVAPDGPDETFVLCRSAARAEKERAIFERFATRLEAGLERLSARARSGALRRVELAWEAIGRLKAANRRAAKLFDITVAETPDPDDARKKKLQIAYVRREDRTNWAQMTEGVYLLRTNLKVRDSRELWKAYIQLYQAEAAFRVLKSDLGIRPIYHHRARRVRAHILVCFLALAMYKSLEQWMTLSGLGSAPRKLIEDLKEVVQIDLVVPHKRATEIRLRLVSRPEQRLRILLDKLRLFLPNRPKNIAKCSGDF
jgi:transposase